MKKITLFLFALFTCWQINAQVSSYSFSQFVGTYTENSAGATTIPGVRADTFISSAQNIGFNFVYDGVTYTQFKMSSNGFISLNMTGTTSLTTNDLAAANATSRPIIAPLWDDLDGATPTTSVASYEVTGTAPNRVLTVEWRNWEWNWNSGATPVISFQTKLYETTNVIEFVYRQETGTVLSGSASIGIGSATGSGAGSYLSLSSVATPAVSSTTSTNTLNTKPATGQVYRFTPPSCSSPSGFAVSNLTTTSATISWNAAVPVPSTGYEYYYSNVNTPPAGAGTPTSALTDNLSGLTPNTTYYVWLRSDCGGGTFSAWAGPFTFFTGYCVPSSTSNSSYVDNFTTSGGTQNISNLASGFTTGGYLDATSQIVESYETGSFDFNATIVGGTVGFAIWIDWNNNLIFEAGEKVYNTTAYGNGPFSGTITVPGGTALGNYRMRITTDWNASNPSNPCAAAARAEFEDYTVTVGNPPTCLVPNTIIASNITSSTVDLSWTDGSGGSQFDYEYVIQAPGTGEPTGAGASIGDVSVIGEGFDIDGNPLMPNTLYEVYVRAVCNGGADFSTWAGPITFRTLCATYVAPYTETFENGGTIPTCWTMSGSENWRFSNTGSGNHIGNNGVITGSTTSGGYFAWVDDSTPDTNDATLTSPMIDVSGLTTPRLTFFELSNNEGVANSTLNVEVWDGAAWNAVASYNTNTVGGWEKRVIDLSTLTITGDIQVRFIIVEAVANFYDDIAIDDVTIEETPSCLEPTMFTVDTVGTDSVTVSWTAGASETEWEYVIQAQGTGVPAGAGVSTTSNPLVISGLTPNTPYEIYLRSVCSVTEQSIWVGPFSFRTNIEVICGTPVNTIYCYDDNDTTTWTFTSSDGSPLRITFNAGQIESCCDDILIYDGIDNSGTLLYQGNNSGNLAGLTFDSTSDSLFFEISSDGSISCGDASYTTQWDFTVACATCINPTATFTNVPNCASGQYSVDVDVTDLGSATSITITDGTNTLTNISATGVQTFGPYASGSSVTITLTNEQDGSCGFSSGAINYSCPPANDDCANAIVLTPGGVFADNDVVGTIVGGTNSAAPAPGCASYSGSDVWYSVAVPASGSITIETNNNSSTLTDTGMAVYSGTCGTLTLVECDDDDSPDGNFSLISLTGRTPGEVLYVLVWEYAGGTEDSFLVSAYDASLSSGSFDNANFVAYPNPVKDFLNVSYSSEISSVRVINMIGQEVISKNLNATSGQVDMSQLSAGTYIVNVTVGDAVKTLKVVKQ